jgi:hypothetical protein
MPIQLSQQLFVIQIIPFQLSLRSIRRRILSKVQVPMSIHNTKKFNGPMALSRNKSGRPLPSFGIRNPRFDLIRVCSERTRGATRKLTRACKCNTPDAGANFHQSWIMFVVIEPGDQSLHVFSFKNPLPTRYVEPGPMFPTPFVRHNESSHLLLLPPPRLCFFTISRTQLAPMGRFGVTLKYAQCDRTDCISTEGKLAAYIDKTQCMDE